MCQQKYELYKAEEACGDIETSKDFKLLRCSTIRKDVRGMATAELKTYFYEVRVRLSRVLLCIDRLATFWNTCVHESMRNEGHAKVRDMLQNERQICEDLRHSIRLRLQSIQNKINADKAIVKQNQEQLAQGQEQLAQNQKQLAEDGAALDADLAEVTGMLVDLGLMNDVSHGLEQIETILDEAATPIVSPSPDTSKKITQQKKKKKNKNKTTDLKDKTEEDIDAVLAQFSAMDLAAAERRRTLVSWLREAESYPRLADVFFTFMENVFQRAGYKFNRQLLDTEYSGDYGEYLLHEDDIPNSAIEDVIAYADALNTNPNPET